MDYFERVKNAVLSVKTLITIVVLGIIALCLLSIASKPSTRKNLYSDDRTQVEDYSNPTADDEVFMMNSDIIPVSEIDYDHYNEMGFTETQIVDSNQEWLNNQKCSNELKGASFDGVNMGKSENGNTDYSLMFYNYELDENATYEVHVYTSRTLENIESRFGSDQCFWVSNGTIRTFDEGFLLNYETNEKYSPYTFIECCEYKDGKEIAYDHALIYDQDGYVTVYR